MFGARVLSLLSFVTNFTVWCPLQNALPNVLCVCKLFLSKSDSVILLLNQLNALQNALPDVLCVVQVALEGAISKKAALNSLAQGNLPQVCLSA